MFNRRLHENFLHEQSVLHTSRPFSSFHWRKHLDIIGVSVPKKRTKELIEWKIPKSHRSRWRRALHHRQRSLFIVMRSISMQFIEDFISLGETFAKRLRSILSFMMSLNRINNVKKWETFSSPINGASSTFLSKQSLVCPQKTATEDDGKQFLLRKVNRLLNFFVLNFSSKFLAIRNTCRTAPGILSEGKSFKSITIHFN